VTDSRSKTVIALKTTHCVLGSANQKVSATTGADGGNQTATLAEEQLVLVLVLHRQQFRHPIRLLQTAVIIDLMVLLNTPSNYYRCVGVCLDTTTTALISKFMQISCMYFAVCLQSLTLETNKACWLFTCLSL